ncbi:M48 family metalloprotease [Streptomyces sp. NPDC005969]|uniref:M48 family metalloprotease n=1 Tax=Streptomyces sp. NPDC005969 TaxID=3156722 RepID=UPI0033C9A3D1
MPGGSAGTSRQAGDLAVVDDPVPTAFAVLDMPGRVVVSSGMLRLLDGPERQALLAHERAHLDTRGPDPRHGGRPAERSGYLARSGREAVTSRGRPLGGCDQRGCLSPDAKTLMRKG